MPALARSQALLGVLFAIALFDGPVAHAQSSSPHFTGMQELMLNVIGRAMPYVRSKDGGGVDLARMPSGGATMPPSRGSEGEAPRPLVDSDDFVFGIEIDAGVPHVVGGNIVWEPWNFLQVRVGGGYNLGSGGIRGGLTAAIPLIDFLRSFTITGEGGHYFEGDSTILSTTFISTFFGEDSALASSRIRSVIYDYASGLLGIELGSERLRFTIQAGATYFNAIGINAAGADDATGWTIAPAGRMAFSVFLL